MRVINIVDSGERINFGVWIGAVSLSQALKQTHRIDSELWIPLLSLLNSYMKYVWEGVIYLLNLMQLETCS